MNDISKNSENLIKEILLKHLLESKKNISDFAITEFSIANFSRRVDILLAKKDNLYAFEIKSEFDSLGRLEGQVYEYLKHFDKVTVVVATKHINAALAKTPHNVAVWEISQSKIKIKRTGKISIIKDKHKYIKMMTLSELIALSKKNNLKPKGKKRIEIEEGLYKLSIKILKKEAINNIKTRYKKRNLNFYTYNNLNILNIAKEVITKKQITAVKKNENKIDSYLLALDSFNKKQ